MSLLLGTALTTGVRTIEGKRVGIQRSDVIGGALGITKGLPDANADEWKKALQVTGIDTELIQDDIADLAHVNYEDYLARKRAVLAVVRSKVLETFVQAKQIYAQLGYSEEQAEKHAHEVAKDVKASYMKIYNTLFPHSGQKIKKSF